MPARKQPQSGQAYPAAIWSLSMKKTIAVWVIASASAIPLAACSRSQPSPDAEPQKSADAAHSEKDRTDQLKIDTVKKMYAEDRQSMSGDEILYKYSTAEFKAWLDMPKQFPGEICGYEHDILTQSQDSASVQGSFSYSLDPQGLVTVDLGQQSVAYELICGNGACLINDAIESGGQRLSQAINEDCSALQQHHAEQQAMREQVKLTYRFDSQTSRLGNTYVTLNNLIISSESDMPADIQQIRVNRGNCPVSGYAGQNHVLSFGQTYKVELKCDPRDVKEVNITMRDGLELTMKPRH